MELPGNCVKVCFGTASCPPGKYEECSGPCSGILHPYAEIPFFEYTAKMTQKVTVFYASCLGMAFRKKTRGRPVSDLFSVPTHPKKTRELKATKKKRGSEADTNITIVAIDVTGFALMHALQLNVIQASPVPTQTTGEDCSSLLTASFSFRCRLNGIGRKWVFGRTSPDFKWTLTYRTLPFRPCQGTACALRNRFEQYLNQILTGL